MPTSTTGNWNNRGFTLIEVAIVVLLIGIFSAMTLPMVTGVGQNHLDATARRLAGTVKYLFNESALSGRPFRLVYDLDAGSYVAKRQETSGELVEVEGTGRLRTLKEDVRFAEITIAGRGTFTSGQVSTEIRPIGWMEETVIHLEDEGQHKLTLRIMPFTGSTEIYEGHREF